MATGSISIYTFLDPIRKYLDYSFTLLEKKSLVHDEGIIFDNGLSNSELNVKPEEMF